MLKITVIILILISQLISSCSVNTRFIESKNNLDISELNGSYFFIPESINFDSLQVFHGKQVFGFISKTPDLTNLCCFGYLPFFEKIKFKNITNDSITSLLPYSWHIEKNMTLCTASDGKNYFRARLDSLNGNYYLGDTLKLQKWDTIAFDYIKNTDINTFNNNHIIAIYFYFLILQNE